MSEVNIQYVIKTIISQAEDIEGYKDISAYFKDLGPKKKSLTNISSSSFLALMNASTDCSSLDRKESSLVKGKERMG